MPQIPVQNKHLFQFLPAHPRSCLFQSSPLLWLMELGGLKVQPFWYNRKNNDILWSSPRPWEGLHSDFPSVSSPSCPSFSQVLSPKPSPSEQPACEPPSQSLIPAEPNQPHQLLSVVCKFAYGCIYVHTIKKSIFKCIPAIK